MRYDNDFKKKIVNMYNSGYSVQKLSYIYDISCGSIYNWIKQLDNDKKLICKKYDEIYELKTENLILRKAVAILAKK
jgi:transposase